MQSTPYLPVADLCAYSRRGLKIKLLFTCMYLLHPVQSDSTQRSDFGVCRETDVTFDPREAAPQSPLPPMAREGAMQDSMAPEEQHTAATSRARLPDNTHGNQENGSSSVQAAVDVPSAPLHSYDGDKDAHAGDHVTLNHITPPRTPGESTSTVQHETEMTQRVMEPAPAAAAQAPPQASQTPAEAFVEEPQSSRLAETSMAQEQTRDKSPSAMKRLKQSIAGRRKATGEQPRHRR